jgi:hypothetical protein
MHPLTRSFYDPDAETNLAIDHVVDHLHEPLRLRDLALALKGQVPLHPEQPGASTSRTLSA